MHRGRPSVPEIPQRGSAACERRAAMKTSSVMFAELRRVLQELGFTETRVDEFWRFEHPDSDTVFLFRPYALDEHISLPDLASTRIHLDWRGLLSANAFDDLLAKTPA
jgi:hypothetical protein